ncbi:EamA family transporter [Pedobacter yulinensis]|uniref:EamA family transporter n=1 Tax=Pedobacter yulinensis TaxID=2126353 RepID=A0A2T3HLU0_9SPHI|nr:DMT family transporter [Pedobacter yulinensis]PST83405.1 EamA family transporter [Pedobacter yulinensis]
MAHAHNKFKGFVLVITAATIWGVSGALGQFLFTQRGINTEWLVTVRLLVSGLILLSVGAAATGKRILAIWKEPRDSMELIIFSLFGMLAVQYTYFAAISHSNAATATVLQYAGPVLITVYLALKKGRWPAPVTYLALAMAVSGTFLLVTHGDPGELSITPAALFWGIASAVTLAFYSIYPTRLMSKFSSVQLIGWAMFIGGLVFSFVHAPWQVSGTWDIYTWAFLAFIILCGSLVSFYAYLTAIRLVGAQTASLLASAEPLSAAIIAVSWLHVDFSAFDYAGSLLILSTLFLLGHKEPA